jgi:LAO/AO transport system kinase
LKNQTAAKNLNFYVEAIRQGNRVVLAQAITLAESQRVEDIMLAQQVITELLPQTGKSVRIGITGVPGVGKSTFIESIGKHLTDQGKKVAVLAVDPSSVKTKGSILGDKTRMENLAKDPNAFIRPSATGSTLGGVADCTRETILLCEAAGFDVIIVETVGVGQSETAVRNMVDFFLLLMLAGAGDELQGIKKGIMEMADAVVITKADSENKKLTDLARANYQHALHLLSASDSGWTPKVSTCSALENRGIAEVWTTIETYLQTVQSNGYFESNRKEQNQLWFQDSLDNQLRRRFANSKKINSRLEQFESQIATKQILPSAAAQQIIEEFFQTAL